MNALDDNAYTRAWAALGERYRPSAILMVSAHWYVPGVAVTAVDRPRTIHDFGGFPRALFEVEYPAPGDSALVARVADSRPGVRLIAIGARSAPVGALHAYPKPTCPWCS